MRVTKGFDSFSYLLDLEEFEVVHVEVDVLNL